MNNQGNSWELNEKSKKMPQPDNLNIPLKQHQLAMLFKCLQIEKNSKISQYPYCILGDKAGAGKTAVMISLILSDKLINKKTQNLIVVPQNIHSQWINEFNKFCKKGALSVKEFIDYSQITELFFDNSIVSEYDVLITTSMYYNMVIDIFRQTRTNIKRVIFDEIDNMINIVQNGSTKNNTKNSILFGENKQDDDHCEIDFTWFISASYENCITEKGFKFKEEIIPFEKLEKIICKCDDNFVNKYISLAPPVVKNITCDDISDVFSECLSVEQFDNINSLNFRNGYSKISQEIPLNSKELIKTSLKDYLYTYNKNEEMIVSITESAKIKDPLLKQTMIKKEEKSKYFIEKIIEEYYKSICRAGVNIINENLKIDEKVKKVMEFIDSYEVNNSKLDMLEDIVKQVSKNDKMLLFSDFPGSFEYIDWLFNKYNIKCEILNGGNIQNTDTIIDNYKNKDTSVLLIDSSSEGCGLNLENTNHVLFLHKTSEMLYNQVIARALRLGRKTNLTITTLLNKNELVV